MVVKDTEKRFSFFREIRLNIFPKTFIVTDPSWIKTSEKNFPHFFVKSAAVILFLFKILLKNFAIHLVNERTFPKYDRFIMAFLKVLVTHGAWFARTTFFFKGTFLFKGTCLFKTAKKTFSKWAYSSTDCSESLFWISRLKLSSWKFLQFLYDIYLAFAFEKCNLNTDKTNLWKSDSPVKTFSVLKKLFGLFC